MISIILLIQTEWAQNLLVQKITQKLSRSLNTTVSVDHISIGFFNRLNLKGTLILDQHKDTLLYAGNLRVSITDWFFLKDEVEIQYLGLENAFVNVHRTDSVWNYLFLEKAFASDPNAKKTNKEIKIKLKDINLKNIRFVYTDRWVGENMIGKLGALSLKAKNIDLAKKQIEIRSLSLDQPSFSLIDYTGNRPDSLAPSKKLKPFIPGVLKWNPEKWFMKVDQLTVTDGAVYFQADTQDPILPHFDPDHIYFTGITGKMKSLVFDQDTLSAKIQLKTKERSGFMVSKLKADWHFDPETMRFSKLELITPYSRLGDAYTMRYDRFKKDMKNFISKVKLELTLKNSIIHSKDIAFFAPELDGWNKIVKLSGSAKGTVEDFQASDLNMTYGKESFLRGNLSMKGLPDMDKTHIHFSNGQVYTTYTDAIGLYPALNKITKPDLKQLQYLRYDGSFTGTIKEFVTNGTVTSPVGSVSTSTKFTIPSKGEPAYASTVNTDNFDLGKLFGDDQLGKISFHGKLSGKGFSSDGNININGTIPNFDFNNYRYQNILVDGRLQGKEFNGKIAMDDPNAKIKIDGFVDLKDPKNPEINILTQLSNANLKPLHFSTQDISVMGNGRLNFIGKDIDHFIGEAALYDLAFTRNNEVYIFDTLSLYSMNIDDRRHIEVKNTDFSAVLDGKFTLSNLASSISHYLSRYYPSYFKNNNIAIPQNFSLKVDVQNIDKYIKLIDPKLSGFNYSSIVADIQSDNQIFTINADIPIAQYGKYRIEDFRFKGDAGKDSLRMTANAGNIIINDSLQLPNTALAILAANDHSDISINTSANQALNAANLSAGIQHLDDGFAIQFKPSSFVVNDKTWRIDKGGALTIRKSVVDASEIRIYNGEQQLLISSIPSELGNSHDIIVELKRVNLGDLLPYVLQEPRIQGITSGEITIEDPLNKFKVFINAQTDQTRFENDSIGITTLNGYYDKQQNKVSFNLESENPGYQFLIEGKVDLADSLNPKINAFIDLNKTKISVLQTYLEDIFSKMDGTATGRINIIGNANTPELLGTVKLENAGMEIDFTKVYYKIEDTDISFREGLLDLGTLKITDPLGNRGTVSGKLKHHFFNEMEYDFKASSSKILAINTSRRDNDLFHGKAIARLNFSFTGDEENMKLYINGAAVDSSNITIETSSSTKQTGEVEYIKWRQYGREMNPDSIKRQNSNLSMEFDLVASPILKMTVVLDPLTGDSITSTGAGNLKIRTGTNEALTLNGRYNIEKGAYNFNFQDIFNKPFYIEQNSGSYISWTGDPYNAEININAKYIAEKVRMSTLFEAGNTAGVSTANSDVMREISDVWVMCNLSGTLTSPITSFQLLLPPFSSVKNNPTIENKLKTINRDQNEASKQSTYLIVFKSFAPQAAIVTSNLNLELLSNTISGVINGILSNSIQNFFYKLFGSSVDVNFNYSRVSTSIDGNAGTSQNQNIRENASLEFIKSLVNNRLILTFGGDVNFNAVGNTVISNQNFLLLPDVNVEYKITPDGKFRASFFYRSSFDVLSSSGKRERTGGNFSFRTEFDHIFRRKKKGN